MEVGWICHFDIWHFKAHHQAQWSTDTIWIFL